MGYIKVAHQEILRHLDNYSEPPKGWENFVKKQEIHHNLIIKSSKNKCFCTNCKNYFSSKKKINEETKCPNCNNKYLIKRSNLKYYEFKDYLSILDKVDNTFIIRYFELKTIIDASHEHNSSVVEFAREIPNNNYYRDIFINERVSKCQCYIYIHHSNSSYFNPIKWRKYTRNYSLINYSIVFPNNIKGLLKDTEYKYSCIWDIAKHCTYFDIQRFLSNNVNIDTIEILAKMKLYNLALKSDKFIRKESFQKIFGVPKDYYPFMKKHNITYKQLKILQLLKEKDIKKIRYLENYIEYGEDTNNLEEIASYIGINRFIKYSKMHHKKVDIYLYKDYLGFANVLGLDLKNNKYAFPKNLKEEHDKLEKQYEVQKNKFIINNIIKRGRELSVNKYQNKEFIIIPADTLKSLENESKQQNNCVRTYAEKYAKGTCDIYFMRTLKEQKKSLVTVEVKNNRVVQSRIKNNNQPTEKHLNFLQKWENKVLKGTA